MLGLSQGKRRGDQAKAYRLDIDISSTSFIQKAKEKILDRCIKVCYIGRYTIASIACVLVCASRRKIYNWRSAVICKENKERHLISISAFIDTEGVFNLNFTAIEYRSRMCIYSK